ncbi:unnamed protein product [Ixodes pacificus]
MVLVGGNEADGALVPFGCVERDLDSVRTGHRSRIQSRCMSRRRTGAGIEDVRGSVFLLLHAGVHLKGNAHFGWRLWDVQKPYMFGCSIVQIRFCAVLAILAKSEACSVHLESC